MNTSTPPVLDEVNDLLLTSVADVFETVLRWTAQPAPFQDIRQGDASMIVGSVGFVGSVNGMVHLYFLSGFARQVTSRMLEMPEPEIDDEMVGDVVGEIGNMIVGSVKSRLCDAGVSCTLTIPSVVRGDRLTAQPGTGVASHLQSIACNGEHFLIELCLKPNP